MDVFFLGLTDSMIARELDRYQNPEPVGDCFDDIDFPEIDCYRCHKLESKCSCRIADCASCGEVVSRATGYHCETKFHGLKIANLNYHPQCWEKTKSQEAA